MVGLRFKSQEMLNLFLISRKLHRNVMGCDELFKISDTCELSKIDSVKRTCIGTTFVCMAATLISGSGRGDRRTVVQDKVVPLQR